MLAGGGVFGQDFVADFYLLDGLLAFVGVDEGAGGEGVGNEMWATKNVAGLNKLRSYPNQPRFSHRGYWVLFLSIQQPQLFAHRTPQLAPKLEFLPQYRPQTSRVWDRLGSHTLGPIKQF